MKPNVLTFSTIITFISMLMIPITESHVTECWIMTMYNKNSKCYVNVHNDSVFADSTEKYPLYAINLEQSIKFYLYDPRTDTFICMNKRRKLLPKRNPTEAACTFEDKVLYVKNISTPYIQYYQPHFNETFKFNRRGFQFTMKKLRHNHTRKNTKSLLKNMSGFLPNKFQLETQECVRLKHSFCCNMRKNDRLSKLPESLRTLCAGILNFQAYLKCE